MVLLSCPGKHNAVQLPGTDLPLVPQFRGQTVLRRLGKRSRPVLLNGSTESLPTVRNGLLDQVLINRAKAEELRSFQVELDLMGRVLAQVE